MSGDDQRRVAASVKQRLLNYSRDRGEVFNLVFVRFRPTPRVQESQARSPAGPIPATRRAGVEPKQPRARGEAMILDLSAYMLCKQDTDLDAAEGELEEEVAS